MCHDVAEDPRQTSVPMFVPLFYRVVKHVALGSLSSRRQESGAKDGVTEIRGPVHDSQREMRGTSRRLAFCIRIAGGLRYMTLNPHIVDTGLTEDPRCFLFGL